MPPTEPDDTVLDIETDITPDDTDNTSDEALNGIDLDNPDGGDRSIAVETAKDEGSAPDKAAAGPKTKAGTTPVEKTTPPTGAKGQGKKPSQAATTPKQTTHQSTVDPHKAWNDEKAHWGRERAEFARQLQTYQKAEQERKETSERLNLKRFDPRHPEHQQFRTLMGRRDALPNQLNAIDSRTDITPEQKTALRDAIVGSTFSEAERAELQDHQQMNREFLLNPIVSAREEARTVAREEIREMLRQQNLHTQAQKDVDRDMADPAKIAPHADFIKARIDAGDPYPSIMERVKMLNEIADLKAKVGQSTERESTVDRQAKANAERARLAKGNATVGRNAKVSGQPDFYAESLTWAEGKGVKPGSPKHLKHLRELEENHVAAQP